MCVGRWGGRAGEGAKNCFHVRHDHDDDSRFSVLVTRKQREPDALADPRKALVCSSRLSAKVAPGQAPCPAAPGQAPKEP